MEELYHKRIKVAQGALVHDIGKVILRLSKEEYNKMLSQAGKEYHYKEKFKYSHAYLSYLILKTLFPEENYIIESSYHHAPQKANDKELAFIYQIADVFSSKERSKEEKELSDNLLRPVFQSVTFGERTKDKFVYPLAPLNLQKEVLFPKKGGSENILENEEYKKLWNLFENEVKNLTKSFKNKEKDFLNENFLSRLYHLCYKYLWCVPASTYDTERKEFHYPDISLFDHVRVTAAIATSLCTEFNQEKIKKFVSQNSFDIKKVGKEVKLVIIRGDLSGIQNFLYDIANIKGAAKRLRGRSIFLALLPELVSRKLLKDFGYPFINTLFCGGGHFEVVIGYEEGIEEKLNIFESKVEEILVKELGGKIGLILGFKIFALEEIKNYSKLVEKLHKEIERKKKRKFLTLIKEEKIEELINRDFKEGGEYVLCPSCRWVIVKEREGEERVCKWCEIFSEVGGVIPKSKYVVFSEEKLLDKKGFFMEGIGGVYFLDEEESEEVIKSKEERGLVFKLNDTNFLDSSDGFRFLALTVPKKKQNGKEEVLTFEEISQEAEGDKKIGFARADVDNLGLIFRLGLGENYTISRVAGLSRMLDLFFSGYLNALFNKDKFKNKIYTVYAGGDDLFIIGPWNTVIDAISEVRKEFKAYTCENEEFNISCGIFTTRENYPLRLAGECAGREEDNAKEVKPAICVLGEVLSWEVFEEALEEANKFIEKIKNGERLGRTLIHKLYLLLKEYKLLGEEKKYKIYPMFFYYLLRNVGDKKLRHDIFQFFMKVEKDYEVKEDALFKAKYVIMKTRR